MNTRTERSNIPTGETITDRSEVLGQASPAHTSPAGGKVVSCDLDEACVHVDCDQFAEAIEGVLDESLEAPDYVMHYCGVDYLKPARATESSAGGEGPKDK